MSMEAVQAVIGRAATDPEFREELVANARKACADYDLTDDELEALEALDAQSLNEFAGKLDKRISKSGGKGFLGG